MLPLRTTIEDIIAVCQYLTTKPTGATPAEMKAVVDGKHLESRKISALRYWGLLEESAEKLKVTELGRRFVRESGAYRSDVLREVVQKVNPYRSTIERIVNRNEQVLPASELAAYWYEHFRDQVSDSEKVLNEQAICFFQIAEGADLGTLFFGRRGMSTRFEFDSEATRRFVNTIGGAPFDGFLEVEPADETQLLIPDGVIEAPPTQSDKGPAQPERGNRVFITHGKNLKILDQVKQIVTFGKFEPVVAMENESLAKPVPQKVMDEMRTCDAAVIHVSAERVVLDEDGAELRLINENVLIEIGAAIALYGDRFILLVEEGVKLPTNLQGLYECRYKGTELDMPATMKLLEAFNEFGG